MGAVALVRREPPAMTENAALAIIFFILGGIYGRAGALGRRVGDRARRAREVAAVSERTTG
jgi:hypothetical protein